MTYSEARNEYFAGLGRERVLVGDLFAHPVIVVPIKTAGRWYGSISRAVANLGVGLPVLATGCVELREVGERSYVFVALWNDQNEYTARHIYDCTRACLHRAAQAGLTTLALPLLGGNQGRRFLGAMEHAVDDEMDACAEQGLKMPDVVFVTDHELA